MNTSERAVLILEDIKKETGTSPIEMFNHIVAKDYMNMHGPEHHILDGACRLMAYKNAGGDIDIDEALNKLAGEGLRMPGAMCGLWGICGAITSVGAAIAIIDHTGPLSTDGSWGEHMSYISKAVEDMGHTHGPRCCKRDAMIAFRNGIEYINEHHDVTLTLDTFKCVYSHINAQCIGESCPFFNKK